MPGGDPRAAAAIRHECKSCVGGKPKQKTTNVLRAADSTSADSRLVRIDFQPSDKTLRSSAGRAVFAIIRYGLPLINATGSKSLTRSYAGA